MTQRNRSEHTRTKAAVVALLLLAAWAGAARAADPAATCQADKNKEAAKYASCRHKAEATLAKTSDAAAHTAALAKCATAYAKKWQLIETKAAGACPSSGDQATIQVAIDAHTTNVAAALNGGPLDTCSADLATCRADRDNLERGLCDTTLTVSPISITIDPSNQLVTATLTRNACDPSLIYAFHWTCAGDDTATCDDFEAQQSARTETAGAITETRTLRTTPEKHYTMTVTATGTRQDGTVIFTTPTQTSTVAVNATPCTGSLSLTPSIYTSDPTPVPFLATLTHSGCDPSVIFTFHWTCSSSDTANCDAFEALQSSRSESSGMITEERTLQTQTLTTYVVELMVTATTPNGTVVFETPYRTSNIDITEVVNF